MLVIRLTRFGKKKKPFYRIVVADSRSAVSGKYIEKIGHYNPLLDPPEIFVDKEKAKKWLKSGAKPSDTVWNLLVEVGILKKKIVTQRKKQKKEKKETEEKRPMKEVKEAKEETEEAKPPETSGKGEEKAGEKASSKTSPEIKTQGLSGRSASESDINDKEI